MVNKSFCIYEVNQINNKNLMNQSNSGINSTVKPTHIHPSPSSDNTKSSKPQLHDLINNDHKFECKIKQLNAVGVNLIHQEQEKQALTYLLQAERILQYAASCGRTIDRLLITTTLQNQACAYQRIWDLKKSSDYMQAIIYNIKPSLDCTPFIQYDITVKDEESQDYHDLSTFLNRRIQGVFYYLQFSAVNSQINQHKQALESTKKSLVLLESICRECLKYQKIKKGKNSILMQDLIDCFNFQSQKLRGLLAQTKQALHALQRHRQFFSFDTEVIENFVIGEVMQISTTTVEEAIRKFKVEEEITHLGIIYKVLYLSICYFVMGTQLRLISKERSESQFRAALVDLNTSKMYHLYAIKIAATLAPCDSKYLQHVVKSFKNHYEIDLYAQDFMIEEFVMSQKDQGRQIEEIEMKRKQEKFQKSSQTQKICFQNTKLNTFETEQLQANRESREFGQKFQIITNKSPKSPILKNKKKNTKKQVSKSRTVKIAPQSQNVYIFPSKKASRIQKGSKEKNYQTKKSREIDCQIATSRQRQIPIQGNPQKISRVKKVKQQYFMKEGHKKQKNIKNSNKSKSKDSLDLERVKKSLNSKQKSSKNMRKC